MTEKSDVRTLFYIIQKTLREFQDDMAYFKLCKNPRYPLMKNSEIDILLNWERDTVIALEKLQIHLGLVDYGPDKEEALKFVDEHNPQFKYNKD
ncbi:MAG: hypothetical protein NWE80_00700 [Candidatus Bathyarchaeota archaeon]|nr:hypothetical protein [Candidatus Bathyarchaeota archaeon]